MKKYFFLSFFISMGSAFSQNTLMLPLIEKSTYQAYSIIDHDHGNTPINLEEEQEHNENITNDSSLPQTDQEVPIPILDNSVIYSQHFIKPNESTSEPSSSVKNDSQNLFSSVTNTLNNNTAPTSHSLSKNPSGWWNSRTHKQKGALIKTGIFIVGCGVAAFFPELPIGEKLFVLVCLPCFIELGETVMTAVSACR